MGGRVPIWYYFKIVLCFFLVGFLIFGCASVGIFRLVLY